MRQEGNPEVIWVRPHPDHFRITFLPHEDTLREAMKRIAHFLERYRNKHALKKGAAATVKA